MKIKQHKDSFVIEDQSNIQCVVIDKDSKNIMSQMRFYCYMLGIFNLDESVILYLLDQKPIIFKFYGSLEYTIMFYYDSSDVKPQFSSVFPKNTYNYYSSRQMLMDNMLNEYYNEKKTT